MYYGDGSEQGDSAFKNSATWKSRYPPKRRFLFLSCYGNCERGSSAFAPSKVCACVTGSLPDAAAVVEIETVMAAVFRVDAPLLRGIARNRRQTSS